MNNFFGKVLGDAHPNVLRTLDTVTSVLRKEGKLEEAETVCRDYLVAVRGQVPADDPQLAGALAQLTSLLIARKKFDQAEPLARECLEIREKKLPDSWQTYSTRNLLGASLLGLKQYAQAEPLLLSSYEGMRHREGSIHNRGKSRLKEAIQDLERLYDATGETNQATHWKQRLEEFERAKTNRVSPAQTSR